MGHLILKELPSSHQFWVVDGRSLKNLEELAVALQDMDESTFRQHVNEHKNDFHNWIRDVHQDKKLAETLLKIKQRKHAFYAVQERIQELLQPQNNSQKKNRTKKVPLKIPTPSSTHSSPKPFWYQQYLVWVILIFTLFAVVLVGTVSPIAVTGAAVGSVVGRGTALLGMTLVIMGILFIVAALKKEERIKRKNVKRSP